MNRSAPLKPCAAPGALSPAIRAACAAMFVTLSACAGVPGDAGFSDVSATVEARTGAAPVWTRTEAGRREVENALDRLLASPVGQNEAVAIAFVNSPRLQAELENLGAARADFLQAVSPPNPFVEILRYTTGDGLEVNASVSLLDLIFWPMRAQGGQAAFDASKAEAAAMLAEAAADVRLAFVDHAANLQKLDLYEQAERAGEAAAAAADAIHEAGNIARLDRDQQRLIAARMTAERMRAQSAAGPSLERLIALLGLDERQAERLRIRSRLPAPPDTVFDADRAGEIAASSSLAAAAAEARLLALASGRNAARVRALLGDAELVGEFEREDGSWSSAAGLGFTFPFDLGAAGRERARAGMRAAAHQLAQTRIDARAQARSAAMEAEHARALAQHHRTHTLPVSAEVFDGVLRDFNAMNAGLFDLLEARRNRIEAGRDYVDAVAGYWRARARLERHVRAEDVIRAARPGPSAPAEQTHERHDHDGDDRSGHHHEHEHEHDGHDMHHHGEAPAARHTGHDHP